MQHIITKYQRTCPPQNFPCRQCCWERRIARCHVGCTELSETLNIHTVVLTFHPFLALDMNSHLLAVKSSPNHHFHRHKIKNLWHSSVKGKVTPLIRNNTADPTQIKGVSVVLF